MQLAYLAVALTILGGNEPETQLSFQGIYSREGCYEWQRNLRSVEVSAVDSASGKSILSREFYCQLIDVDELADMAKEAKSLEQ